MRYLRCWHVERKRELSEGADPFEVAADEVKKITRSELDKRTILYLKCGGIAYTKNTPAVAAEVLGFKRAK